MKAKTVKGVRVRHKATGKVFVFRYWKVVGGVVCYSDGKPVDLSRGEIEIL